MKLKNIFVLLITLIVFLPLNVFANEKKEVQFKSCIDGDTARFIMDNEEIKVRFLAIDTPETNHPTKKEEPYGKEAKEYTCNKISNANRIELEFDEKSDKKDKYDRYLAWVYVDGNLLQIELIQNGLAKVAYIYGDYSYLDRLKEEEKIAINKKIGLYSDIDNSSYTKNRKVENNNKTQDKIYEKLIDTFNKFLKKIIKEIF